MTTRFADRLDVYSFLKASPEFKVRNHGAYVLWLTYAFGISILAIVASLFYVFYRISVVYTLESMPINDILMAATFVVMIMAILAFYVYLVIRRIKILILATEFLNLLLAGAARLDTSFCLIFNSKKQVAYADERATGYFVSDRINSLDELLFSLFSHKGISNKDQELMESIFENPRKIEVGIKFIDPDGVKRKSKIVIEPILKVSGFFVLRGHDE